MSKSRVTRSNIIPHKSIIGKGFKKIGCMDSYRVETGSENSIDAIVNKVLQVPGRVLYLLRIRNAVAGTFGPKTGKNFKLNQADHYPVGSGAVYFTVTDRNANEIVMAEDDRHMNFRTSLTKKQEGLFSAIYLTTLIKYYNLWGRMYFLPVKPFHCVIMRALIRRLLY